jgi:hypothetical protein
VLCFWSIRGEQWQRVPGNGSGECKQKLGIITVFSSVFRAELRLRLRN